MMETVDGRLVVIAGASRTGKTAFTVQQVKDRKRIIAWDPEDQFSTMPGWKRITTRRELFRAIESPNAAKLAYVAGGNIAEEFDFWAASAFFWGRYYGGCVAIAEELADVTTPSKAPGNWGILLRRGLKRGITIFAISQRWSEADKTAFGNASEYVCFRLSSGMDVDYMAKRTRIKSEQIAALQNLQYVRMDAQTGEISAGKLNFSKKK